MSEEISKFWIALWGGALSTLLGSIKLWETFWRDRIRMSVAFSFTGQEGVADEITIINLPDQVVQVSHWKLSWDPLMFSAAMKTDVTPEDSGGRFTMQPRSEYTLKFYDNEKFDWGWEAAKGRKLILTLFLFGQSRKVRLPIQLH